MKIHAGDSEHFWNVHPEQRHLPVVFTTGLNCCLCEFVPLLNWRKECYGCILIYITGNDKVSLLMSAISRYEVIRNSV